MYEIIEKEVVDVTPDTSLFPKTGKTGYTLTQAIAELVDNSIDARIPGKRLIIKIVLSQEFIIVEDNAKGMRKNEAKKALVLGHSRKEAALGEFGIGLKASCTSLGQKFKVITRPKDYGYGYIYEFDENEWLRESRGNDWTMQLGTFKKFKSESHGTEIKIEKLRRRVTRGRKNDLLRDFGNRFGPFINNEKVKIFVNQVECRSEKPELIKGTRKSFQIQTKNGEKIWGWYGLMKKGSDKGLYGFDTFRRGRMITTYDKIGIFTHPTVSRIIGQIHLDHVPVSHNKKEFEKETREYREAKDLLKEEFSSLVREARKRTMVAKVTGEVKKKIEDLKEAIVKAFHELRDDFEIEPPQKQKRSIDPTDPLGNIVIEKRSPALNETINDVIEKMKKRRNPKNKRQKIYDHYITIKGKRYDIIHDFSSLGRDASWKTYEITQDSIIILTNIDFPTYSITSDVAFYGAMHIAESIGEIVAKVEETQSTSRAQEVKENILRKAFRRNTGT